MDIILPVLYFYFCIGFVALGVLDAFTGRIHSRLSSASAEAQNKILATGNFVGRKTSVVLVIFAMWLFWPLVIWSALRSL